MGRHRQPHAIEHMGVRRTECPVCGVAMRVDNRGAYPVAEHGPRGCTATAKYSVGEVSAATEPDVVVRYR